MQVSLFSSLTKMRTPSEVRVTLTVMVMVTVTVRVRVKG